MMSTGNTSSRRSPQFASISRSGSRARMRARFGHDARWIVMPLPRVTKPAIGSGGAGLQQRASPVISRSTPTIRMPLPEPLALLARVTIAASPLLAAGAGAGATAALIAVCSWRRLSSSRA